jgi:manganese/zinc/iron transport system ATP- binding protein
MLANDHSIQLDNVTVTYDATPVLWNISVDFKKGKMTAIIGPNGAGKSTLIKSMLDLEKRIAGNVLFNIDDNTTSEPYQSARNEVAYVPQKNDVDWDFPTTVIDVVTMGRYGKLGWFKRPTKKDRKIAEEKLDAVGMSSFKNRQISQLSGGQRQRVFLARALAQETSIYILDEPLAGVDMKTESIIIKLLKDLARQGKTVIIVHHDLRTVPEYFDEVVFLNHEIIAAGPVDSTFTEDNIEETYRKDRNLGEEAVE